MIKDSFSLPIFYSILLIHKWTPLDAVPYSHKLVAHEASNAASKREKPHNVMIG